MKYSRKIILTFSLLLFAFSSNLAVAKGAEIKFSSLVSAISQIADKEGTVTVSIHGIDVSVIINGDTEIESGGEEINLATLSVGDFVRIRAFFSDAGIVADEVNVLDERSEQFRFRGLITATDSLDENTIITIMGVDVYIDSATDITRRGSGDGNSVAAAELMTGDEVNVRGGSQDGLLLAARIHVGSREIGNIELEGEIVALTDSGFTIDIRGSGTTDIIVDNDTNVSGDIIVGAFVEIEGQLDSAFAVLAFEVVVDVDGDGDADDDNKRGKRGHGNNNGDDDDDGSNDDDDDGDTDGSGDDDSITVGAEISLAADDSDLNGKVETKYRSENGNLEQKLEIELEDATAGAVYTILVFFGDESVSFGSITANDFGVAEVEYETGDEDPDRDLSALLPDGRDVRDITGVQILLDGDIVLEGDF